MEPPRRVFRRSAALALALLAVPFGLPRTAHALAKVDSGDESLELTGNLRLLGGLLHFDPSEAIPDDGLLAVVGRLILKGNLAKNIDYDVHLFLDVDRSPTALGSAAGGAFSTAGSFVTPYRTPSAQWRFWSSAAGSDVGNLGIDRLSLHARFGRFDLTAGRFPINDAVAHIVTTNDFFAPFSATAINKAYKPGVDAVRAAVSLGRTSSLEVRAILGSDALGKPQWADSAITARGSTVLGGFDFALVAGKLAGRWIAGGTFQGSLGPIDLRGEGHVGMADAKGDGSGFSGGTAHGRFSTGLGWRSPFRNFGIDAEYAYFSDGASRPADLIARAKRFFPDDLPFLGQHYMGVAASIDIVPILKAAALGLVNAQDGSGLAVVSLSYDISDESAFSAGLMVPWGGALANLAPRSEFGIYPLTLFVESRFYF